LPSQHIDALVLGSGGSSKAVQVALSELDIDYGIVSRKKNTGDYTYAELKKDPNIIKNHLLIVNTTPLGTFPEVDEKVNIPYQYMTEEHFCYDLVYNPATTAFMEAGLAMGATVKNGYEMLELQAEKSWTIWNTK